MKNWFQNCKKYMQKVVSVYILNSICLCPCMAKEASRAPANFVPDDDAIIVPLVVEKNIMSDFHEKYEKDFRSARTRLEFWISQEQYAQQYGLEETGIVNLPSEEEKQRFLERNYLRFLSRDFERTTNESLQDTLEKWNTDDEIDAIEALELHNKVIVKSEKTKNKKSIGKSKSVKVGKDSFRIGYQVRPEIGMARVDIRSEYFRARAWVGINGNQELNIERRFNSTGTRVFVNYFIDQTRTLGVIDQRIVDHWSLRYTHNKDFEDFSSMTESAGFEDNIIQLRFRMHF